MVTAAIDTDADSDSDPENGGEVTPYWRTSLQTT